MVIPKFNKLPLELQSKIMLEARQRGAPYASKIYAEQADMTVESLYILLNRKLNREKEKLKPTAPEKKEEAPKSRWGKPKEPERELSEEEIVLLDKLEKGEIGITEMSRIVAKQVFSKMLKNPGDFKFIDFFRAELLRQKDEENKIKDKWAGELISRMFAGKLPPRICPNCGEDLVPDSPIITGTVIEEITDGTDA